MLRDDITPLFAATEQIRELFEAEQPEIDALELAVAGWIRELHVMTASGIERWEDDYHLDHNTDLTLEQRRARVFAKKMQRRIPKRENVEEAIQRLLGAVRVSILEKECMFTVTVESMTLIDNLAIAEDYFRKVRVAHFGFTFINQIPRDYRMDKYFAPALVEHRKIRTEVER